MKFKVTLSLIADIVGIVAVAGGPFALPRLLDSYRGLFILAIAVGGSALFYSVYQRINKMRALKRKNPSEPCVLLLGGAAYQTAISQIATHPLLYQQPYIRFADIVSSNVSLRDALVEADSVILMPDFTAADAGDRYREVMSCCKSFPIPVARYYPADFSGVKETDAHCIPFDTPQGIVGYASEFLLKCAVNRARYTESRLQINRRLNWIALAVFAAGLIWGVGEVRYRDLLNRIDTVPPAIRHELAGSLAALRGAPSVAKTPAGSREATLKYLNHWASVQIALITWISRNSDTKFIYVYALSVDKTKLLPVASLGPEGYPLNATDSIAGCAIRHRLNVYWQGDGDQTSKILAWRLNGESAGAYNRQTQHLDLGPDTCKYDNRRMGDPKDQLLCVPIGGDDSENAGDVNGAVCLVADKSTAAIDQPWLRSYLDAQSYMLGLIDLGALIVDDSRLGTSD